MQPEVQESVSKHFNAHVRVLHLKSHELLQLDQILGELHTEEFDVQPEYDDEHDSICSDEPGHDCPEHF